MEVFIIIMIIIIITIITIITIIGDISSWLTKLWDTDNVTLQAGDYSGVANLAILTSILQVSSLL